MLCELGKMAKKRAGHLGFAVLLLMLKDYFQAKMTIKI